MRFVALVAAVLTLGAACATDETDGTDGTGGGDGGAVIEATASFVPEVDGSPKAGCGAYGFRPENRDFRDAFNEALLEMREADEIFPLVEEFDFSQEWIDAAKGVGVDDLVDDALEGEAGGGLLEELQAQGSVTVGFADEPPYGFETADGEPSGEAPTVAREVLTRLGIEEMDGRVVAFGALINGLKAGQFDIIAAGMFIDGTVEVGGEEVARTSQILFSDPDYCIPTALAVAAGNPLNLNDFQDIIDNSDARLGLLAGAVEVSWATGVGVPEDQIQQFQEVADLFDALVQGRVDAVALTQASVEEQVEQINARSAD